MIPLIVICVYAAGAGVAATAAAVEDRLERRENPTLDPDPDSVVLAALVWPLLAVYLTAKLVYRYALNPALNRITDTAEAIINESKNRKDPENDR